MMRGAAGSCLLLGALLATGCERDPEAAPEPEPVAQVAWELERSFGAGGPVQLVLRLDKRELDLSQELLVEEELRCEEGFAASFPDVLPDDLEGLGLVRIRDLPQAREGKHTLQRRRLLIEPERTGDCAIAERWAFFREAGQDLSQEKPLATERIAVHVSEVPRSAELSLPAGPSVYAVDPDPEASSEWPWLAGLALPILGALAAWIAWRRAEDEAPPTPAHELAFAALERLDGLDLLGQGDLAGYVIYLSAILREYVERRYGVQAPERTTEEFLREAGGHERLAEHRPLLEAFLTRVDAVKFAQARPAEAEAREARETVRRFVETTRADRSPQPEPLAAGASA